MGRCQHQVLACFPAYLGIDVGAESVLSCIACPECLKTACLLRSSRTSLLKPNNTIHMATGLVVVSNGTAVSAWPRPLTSSGIIGLQSLLGQTWRVSSARSGMVCICTQEQPPSKRAKLCTYFAWCLSPIQMRTLPCFEISMPISRLQRDSGSHGVSHA